MLPRSAIPRVVGILAMIIAPFGLVWSYVSWRRAQVMSGWDDAERVADTIAYLEIYFFVSIALFFAHAVGGALLCAYRKAGRHLLIGYAVVALALLVADFYVMQTFPSEGPRHDRHGFGALLRFLANLIALPWPIVVLALINTRRARDALR